MQLDPLAFTAVACVITFVGFALGYVAGKSDKNQP